MELKDRQRAATWSGFKVVKTKWDKDKQEWQTAMEATEKCMIDGMQEYWEKMASQMDEKNDIIFF